MTVLTAGLRDISDSFDVAVLDQYGVLHNGFEPYDSANDALGFLKKSGKPVVVLSNSGKRAQLNKDRIRQLGVRLSPNSHVATSGETCWQDFESGELVFSPTGRQLVHPIEAWEGDALIWATGNSRIEIVPELDRADVLLVMGMPEPKKADSLHSVLEQACRRRLPMICTNPDKMSPGQDSNLPSPGTIADRYEALGGRVIWYGKPYPRLFEAVGNRFPDVEPERFLMVGDSMEHDVAGARNVGWSTALVRGGIHRDEFKTATDGDSILAGLGQLAARYGGVTPDYSLAALR